MRCCVGQWRSMKGKTNRAVWRMFNKKANPAVFLPDEYAQHRTYTGQGNQCGLTGFFTSWLESYAMKLQLTPMVRQKGLQTLRAGQTSTGLGPEEEILSSSPPLANANSTVIPCMWLPSCCWPCCLPHGLLCRSGMGGLWWGKSPD